MSKIMEGNALTRTQQIVQNKPFKGNVIFFRCIAKVVN